MPLAIVVFLTSVAVKKAGRHGGAELRPVRARPARWPSSVGCVMSGLTGYIGMTPGRRAATCAPRRRPRQARCRRALQVAFRTGGVAGMFTRRPRPARRHDHHHDLPEHELGHPHRLRLRRLAAGPVPAGRRRHLHQGRRRRCRPGRQGRGRHPRGRPPQPGHHRRQRGRQRRRLRRHGRRPVRELRGHPGRLDHPRRRRVPLHRRQPGARAWSSRSACRAIGVLASIVGVFAVRARQGETNALNADQPRLPRRRHPHRGRHAAARADLRRQRRTPNAGWKMLRRRRRRPGPGPGGQPPHRVLHRHRVRARCRRSPRRPAPARPPSCCPGISSGLESSVYAIIAIAIAIGVALSARRRQPPVLALPRRPRRHGHAGHHRRHRERGHLRPGVPTTPPASPRCPASSTASPSGSW